MAAYDKDWQLIADTDGGKVERKTKALTAKYVITQDGVGEYVTVREYPGGGKDVEWQWTVEPAGEWRFVLGNGHEWTKPPKPEVEPWWSTSDRYECTAEWEEYTPYTEAELAEQAAEEAKAKAEAEEAEYNRELMAALPDAVAELSEAVSDGGGEHSEISDAIAELSQVVSDLCAAVGL